MRKRRGLVHKVSTSRRWLIFVVLSSLPLLLFVARPAIIPEDQSDSRVTILATIDALAERRRYLEAALDVLMAEQASGTRQPGSAGDPTQVAIIDALADLEATTLDLELRLAKLDKRRPTSTPQPTVIPSDECQVGGNVPFENELVALINAQRTAHGLPPLGSQARLVRAARAQSIDMACTGSFSHTGSNRRMISAVCWAWEPEPTFRA